MQLNSLIYPAPQSSYSAAAMKETILWIPRNALKEAHYEETKSSWFSSISKPSKEEFDKPQIKKSDRPPIPCLFLPFASSKLLMYFHGNAEDIGYSQEFLKEIQNTLKINVMAMEYPGYGIFVEKGGCSNKKIKEDAEYMYSFVK